MMSNLQAAGKEVSVVFSSGIACTVYDPGVTYTVDSSRNLTPSHTTNDAFMN